MKTLSLKDWINDFGVQELAKKMKVQPSTVRHWRNGHCLPRTDQMRKIRRLSKGTVSYERMIDSHHKVGGAR
jgi:ribosome-binding protein aMBF1 (putative translation factor)